MIRPLTIDDAAQLAALLVSNREFLAPFEPERPDEYFTVESQRSRIEAADHFFAILDRDAVAGTIALSNVVRGPFQSANLGYWVDRARNGRGLATGAVDAVVKRAFTELGLHRIEAATLVDNVASQRVLEKTGFRRIGTAAHYLRIAGSWRDHVVFQQTVEDR